ncbi:Serine/threonine-protein kinase SSN3 [Podospora fimiseda]|uniref:Serine/threonine-protein kinase SSN3 n=1 Tax=Podospora fimiseda TaxID=252190 RepID=A0AAN7BJN8_9PEZI|nr:Serine/threonine-protein kinase SSN3 [Podospora fimiseda]
MDHNNNNHHFNHTHHHTTNTHHNQNQNRSFPFPPIAPPHHHHLPAVDSAAVAAAAVAATGALSAQQRHVAKTNGVGFHGPQGLTSSSASSSILSASMHHQYVSAPVYPLSLFPATSTTTSGPSSISQFSSINNMNQARNVRAEASFHHSYNPNGIGPIPYQSKVRVTDKYKVIGFISSGTYGRVYKALGRHGQPGEFAIKKFKPDKEGEQITYTGISQSAVREMALCSELHHPNVIKLIEIILEDKCIFMVFEYAEHDLLQIIHHHTQQPRHPIPPNTIRSIMFQLLNGCQYLHTNWVLHRDLKPANIMVTSSGEVKIGDLGLARLFYKPLHSLFSGDKVVVTIWYRAPELLLGSRHYTPAIDMWAVGCIFAELLSLRPIFKGEEAKMDSKKTVPFQRNQMQKIVEIMGLPTKEKWPLLTSMPEYSQLGSLTPPSSIHHGGYGHGAYRNNSSAAGSQLKGWYYQFVNQPVSTQAAANGATSLSVLGEEGYNLLAGLLEYDPEKRLTAAQALEHPFFSGENNGNGPEPISANCFAGIKVEYPHRRVSQDDNDMRTGSLSGTKRTYSQVGQSQTGDDGHGLHGRKRVKEN